MSDDLPIIKVLSFNTTYEMHPKRGTDPLNDDVDGQGFLLVKGKRVMERVAEDWVSYSPVHSPLGTKNVERVRHMVPDPERIGNDEDGAKMGFMSARWSQIEPAYEAWKKGQEMPLNGTPLALCPVFNAGMIDVLHSVGLKTVEEVALLSEVQITRVHLPNMRDIKSQAAIFLKNTVGADAAVREAEKDAQLAAMQERLNSLEALLEQKTTPEPVDADVAELRAELDAKSIAYDKRWAAPKLRQALANEAA